MKKISILSSALMFIALNVFAAAPTTTKSFNAKATVGQLINITQTQQLNFGVIYVNPNQSGTVVLPTAGSISSSVHSLAGGEALGRYTITGGANSGISITVDNTGTISSDTTTLDLTYTPNATSVTLDNDGSGTLLVGGTLNLPSTTPAGTYSGTFNITLSYQ